MPLPCQRLASNDSGKIRGSDGHIAALRSAPCNECIWHNAHKTFKRISTSPKSTDPLATKLRSVFLTSILHPSWNSLDNQKHWQTNCVLFCYIFQGFALALLALILGSTWITTTELPSKSDPKRRQKRHTIFMSIFVATWHAQLGPSDSFPQLDTKNRYTPVHPKNLSHTQTGTVNTNLGPTN